MLTDIALKNLKPESKAYKRSDGGGLFVTVLPNGRKYWGIACRVAGKQKFLSGGAYPEVSLRDARDWREAIKAQIVLGMELTAQPKSRVKVAKTPPPKPATDALEGSFKAVALEWYETRLLGWSPRYAGVLMRRMKADIFPVIGDEPIASITPRQMLEALRAIEKRGSIEMAHRVKNHCSEVFRYAIPDGRCESGPCRDLAPVRVRRAVHRCLRSRHRWRDHGRRHPFRPVRCRAGDGRVRAKGARAGTAAGNSHGSGSSYCYSHRFAASTSLRHEYTRQLGSGAT
ncbi:integrase arm-type DNA-binding domain-containing protein [Sphingomonas sp. So64.6b]|uniref:tyrosine-type recombinase/integrase n=1 Tax=Sphingomonas sp. So64.6b TaxID=2997354 RepID=UPI0016030462|nr:integrase arm-type DNA-binding domain-containing protein [Sphingomonas sp. So64.6b]QNA83688.1 integrase arm-type DNA-binding domain-containing protein [Sphingomonas sp. So64.6b]